MYSTVRTDEHSVAAFEIVGDDPATRTLKEINRVATGIAGPTHVSLSSDDATLLVAHYSGGGVAALPVNDDGSLAAFACTVQHEGSGVAKRQDGPHPHWIGQTPGGKHVLVPDLGTDKVVVYELDHEKHVLNTAGHGSVPAGSGPRHIAFHPESSRVYVANELTISVTAFDYDSKAGTLSEVGTWTALSEDERKVDCTASEIAILPNGKFLYLGIRGNDTIAVFAIDQSTGGLKLVEREPIRGSWPRHFAIDPGGRWLVAAGANSNTATVFKVDQETGRLVFTGNTIRVPKSICVVFQN